MNAEEYLQQFIGMLVMQRAALQAEVDRLKKELDDHNQHTNDVQRSVHGRGKQAPS